jgi:ferredoxin
MGPPTLTDEEISRVCERLTITLRNETREVDYLPGDTIIEAARRNGMRPPFSCLSGSCATCLAQMTAGSVHMLADDALTTREIEQGYVLTCQALPTARVVVVVYEE